MARFTQPVGSSNNGGAALNYVQVAGTQQTISSAPNAIVDLDITTTGAPVQISVTGEGANAAAGSWLRLNLFRDNTEIGNPIQMESSAASENVPFAINFIDDVAAGTYNYSARVTTITGGNWTFGEAAGPVINAVELTGFKGDAGDTGSNGTNGTNGTNGADGASAYDIAVENGFSGTEQEWLDSLVGGGSDVDLGNFTFEDSTARVSDNEMILEALDGDETVSAQIKIGNGDVPINIVAYETDESSYGTGDWATAQWQSDGNGAGQIVLTGITSIAQHLNNFNYDFQKVLINDTTLVAFSSASYGGGNATIDVSEGPAGGTTATVLALRFIQSIGSGMMIDYDDSEMNILASDMEINITTTGGNDLNITSSDDLDLEASDDIRFSSDINGDQKYWSMDSIGQFNLPGEGYISNPSNSSGDGNGYDTIKIVPDSDREQYDQYLIIDPTEPNHIHVRAGGTQDESLAELILGGEDTYVKVSDTDDSVTILANNININSYVSPSSLNINTYSGATIQSNRTSAYSDEDKVVAVLGDINAVVPAETAFTVNGGSLGTMPTFNGDPLFSGTYVKTGPLVHFQIQVDMDNITNFGTGQYYVDLPFPAKYGYQVREGCLHDISADKQYAIGGHVSAGQSRLNLFFTDTNGQDQEFDHNSPITLAVADNFHVSGTYISE
jgi:hypothetical protein